MSDFYLGNKCSINLNFIMYIRNIYRNSEKRTVGIFPYLDIDAKYLLDETEAQEKLKQLWNQMFQLNEILENDMGLWVEKRFKYEDLFRINNDNYKIYEQIKNGFESWYWGTGSSLCDRFSEYHVEDYYNKFCDTFEKLSIKPPNRLIVLQVIYDTIPEGWCTVNKNMIVICPKDKLPKVEDVVEKMI